jgi:hypothetical protein
MPLVRRHNSASSCPTRPSVASTSVSGKHVRQWQARPSVASTSVSGKHVRQWQARPSVASTSVGGKHVRQWQARPSVASTSVSGKHVRRAKPALDCPKWGSVRRQAQTEQLIYFSGADRNRWYRTSRSSITKILKQIVKSHTNTFTV